MFPTIDWLACAVPTKLRVPAATARLNGDVDTLQATIAHCCSAGGTSNEGHGSATQLCNDAWAEHGRGHSMRTFCQVWHAVFKRAAVRVPLALIGRVWTGIAFVHACRSSDRGSASGSSHTASMSYSRDIGVVQVLLEPSYGR